MIGEFLFYHACDQYGSCTSERKGWNSAIALLTAFLVMVSELLSKHTLDEDWAVEIKTTTKT